MNIDNIDVDAAINNAKQLIADERDLSPALRSALSVLLLLLSVLLNRATLDSKNSSNPPQVIPIESKECQRHSH